MTAVKESQTQNYADRLFELLSSGASNINHLLQQLELRIEELEVLFDSDEFTQRDRLQTRLTLFQCRQIGLKLLPELTHRLHQLTESDKHETSRRAINTFLNMAGIPTQPVKHPEPPKPTDDDDVDDDNYEDEEEEPRPTFSEMLRKRQLELQQDAPDQNDINHDQNENNQDPNHEPADLDPETRQLADRLLDLKRNQNLDLTRLSKAEIPRLTDFLLSLNSPMGSPAHPVSLHTNQNPIESSLSPPPAPPETALTGPLTANPSR